MSFSKKVNMLFRPKSLTYNPKELKSANFSDYIRTEKVLMQEMKEVMDHS